MPTLNWHKREEAVRAATRAPYRLLEPVAELSYGDADSENLLIQGDNLDALKALLPYYAGRVKCLAIDPPYNTRSAFEHYDDNLEHSTWLSVIGDTTPVWLQPTIPPPSSLAHVSEVATHRRIPLLPKTV